MRLVILLIVFTFALVAGAAQSPAGDSTFAHVSHSFEFTISAPLATVAPLFGADRERLWAEGWNPQFVYPQPAQDQSGAVFTVRHGDNASTWVNSIYEPENGHIQYVYVVPQAMAVLIDIRLSPQSASACHVKVTYERTALSPEFNTHVQHQGEADAQYGPHWQHAIESYLKTKTGETKPASSH
ncbi:MAG TPA: hypothetical protein VKW06_00920 [Candidatus Angelobacter sp.]|nr:hypothetical protein [Candidatus Angelobacter sp.]